MRWKFILGLLTTCAVLMSMSYTMLIPFLPMYLIQDLGVVKADVDMWSGAIFAITFLVSGIMAPIWGALADKKSRKLMALRADHLLPRRPGIQSVGAARRSFYSGPVRRAVAGTACDHFC